MIGTVNDKQDANVLSMKPIGDIKVQVSLHGILNTTKSVVVFRDLLNCTKDYITKEQGSQDVTACRR